MPFDEAMTEIAAAAKAWRRQLHQYPELLFDLPKTSALVAGKLREFGCDEVVTGIAGTGVIGVIKGRLGAGRTLGFRADMDALPMSEETNLPHASRVANMMHACGHDGHTAMLLAAARYLTATRDFAGAVAVIFQPAEEGGGGARVMIEEGLVERFGIDEVYGMHNQPGLAVGSFAIRPGPMLAAGDRFVVTLNGRGGHAAYPHTTRDPLLAGAHLVGALQTIASRYTNPFDPVVVSVSYFSAGNPAALNVIPASIQIGGTIRTVDPQTRKSVEGRFRDIVNASATLFETQAEIDWRAGYPVTVNDPDKTRVAIAAARSVAGEAGVDDDWPRAMGSEDFSYMLEKRPGAMIWLGNGDSAALHNPGYDFNDDAIIHGMRYWAALVAERLKPGA
ncbi:MAG: amidohydrolase [Gemmobacter sp.]|jgi:hippurate hydrolase|nr:amidohydrolase [Gemmobacter sp.]